MYYLVDDKEEIYKQQIIEQDDGYEKERHSKTPYKQEENRGIYKIAVIRFTSGDEIINKTRINSNKFHDESMKF